MKDIKVLIIEDRPAEAAHLRETLLQLGYQVPATATSLSEGLDYYERYEPDISLVDIYMDGKPDGIVFGMNINEHQERKKPFLFLTSSADSSTFQIAKATRPANYLLKPFNKPELQYAIELALERHERQMPPPVTKSNASILFVKRGNTLVSVNYEEIKYIEVEGKYSKLVCYNQKFVVQQTLADLHKSLPVDLFVRIHRRYVINLKEITKLDTQSHEIFFKDGNTLFFSRRYLDEFLKISTLIK